MTMSMVQAYLGELEQEAKTTKKFLDRLPEDKLTWKPHEKSMTAGQLALHIANIPGGIATMASEDEVPAPDFEKGFPQPSSKAEVLDAFETSLSTARSILPTFDDAKLGATWRIVHEGSPLLELPRGAMLRVIMLNHLYHHRGQFGVYLRLLGAKVPSAYGPSGDEAPDFMAG
jgi:uncharacterized damage-inducible protein DinB